MKKTKKLNIQRTTINALGSVKGAGYVRSYHDGCSNSCNTCNDAPNANGGCWVLFHTDLCAGNITGGTQWC
jgi:hypothetical protein